MGFSIDIIIVGAFLLISLIAGLYSGQGIKNIKEYAIGHRNFSTATLTTTIIATWIGAGFFSSVISETYQNGLWHIVARVGDFLTLLIVGIVFAPRVGEFFGCITVAEVMNSLYGSKVRIITAIASIALSIGYVAVQIKVFSTLFSYFFNVTAFYSALIGGMVIVVYSALGGIRAVTFTDVIQLFTFGVFVPVFALFLWIIFGDTNAISNVFNNNPLFDYHQIFDIHNQSFYISLMLFFYFTIPALDPATFQRILMAKNTFQVKAAFVNASILCLLIGTMGCFIGLVVLSHNPNLNPDIIMMYIVDNYAFTGLKGIVLVAIMAMGMSTADSYINASAVIFSYDICKTLKINVIGNDLLLSRLSAVFIGITAILLVFASGDLFELLLLAGNFYTPIVTVPLMLALLGFRSSSRAVLIGMSSGLISVILWRMYVQNLVNIDSIIPATAANLIAFLLAHYILGEEGGWVGIRDTVPLITLRQARKRKFKEFILSIAKFNFLDFCRNNLPKNEIVFSVSSVFVIISTYSSLYMLPEEIRNQYHNLYNFIYHSVFLFACGFLTYPIWSAKLKNKTFISLTWFFGIFYTLVCVGSMLVILSNFGELQAMTFVLNLIAVGMLFSWQTSLIMIIFGIVSVFTFLGLYLGSDGIIELAEFKVNIIYLLFMTSGFLLTFLKPKQEFQALTIAQNDHLNDRLGFKTQETQKALELKNEFLRNIQHESRTPITGIRSMGETLYESYHILSDEQKYNSLKEIVKSSQRLDSFVNNLVDLSKISNLTYELDRTIVDLSELVIKRLELCKRLYVNDNKELEFIAEIETAITFNCDEHYIIAVLDNLIMNAIQYSKKQGKIIVRLYKDISNATIHFIIKDEGIGIPKEEVFDIFGAFVVSSKTRTPAGGRGVGLALCKKAIELHDGTITADSDGENGSTFEFILPEVIS